MKYIYILKKKVRTFPIILYQDGHTGSWYIIRGHEHMLITIYLSLSKVRGNAHSLRSSICLISCI